MSKLKLTVLSLRYSSWSMRPWLVLYHTGVPYDTETIELPHMSRKSEDTSLADRRKLGGQVAPVARHAGVDDRDRARLLDEVAADQPVAEPVERRRELHVSGRRGRRPRGGRQACVAPGRRWSPGRP